jgi:mannosyl-glycoprotein endo-beta-N-acetylglucosaminidase
MDGIHSAQIESGSAAAIGLVLGIAMDDPSQATSIALLVGQISVAPVSTKVVGIDPVQPRINWANFKFIGENDPRAGILTWDTGCVFTPLAGLSLTGPDDPRPVWTVDHPDQKSPGFLYFNMYVHGYTPDAEACGPPQTASFVGTTGLEGCASRVFIETSMLPDAVIAAAALRFYIQGVMSNGELLSWDRCAFVDVNVPR